MILKRGTRVFVDDKGEKNGHRVLTRDIEVIVDDSSWRWPDHIWVRYKQYSLLVKGNKSQSVIYSTEITSEIQLL